MPGYALLPTMEKPVSKQSFRLSDDEMKERNDWILGAHSRGMSMQEIAEEVGLSYVRVTQIINPRKKSNKETKRVARSTRPSTPLAAALESFWAEDAHPSCAKAHNGYDGECMDCFGRASLIESEYDSNGWPYDWAWSGQVALGHVRDYMKLPDGVVIPEHAYHI